MKIMLNSCELNSKTYRVPVSVIIPCCHEHIKKVEYSVASVAAQSAQPIELIVVNDGGGKKVNETLLSLQYQYGVSWIHVIALPKNIGPGAARNVGWKKAKGEYIAFLDADDAWHPRKIEIQYAFMTAHPEIAICGHRHRQELHEPNWEKFNLTGRYKNVHFLDLLYCNQFITPSAMVRRSIDVQFYNQRHMEDYRLWLTLAVRKKRIIKLEDELACIFKPQFGMSGLSSELVQMEMGELRTYLAICHEKPLLTPLLVFLIPYSFMKFFRRLFLVMIRDLIHK